MKAREDSLGEVRGNPDQGLPHERAGGALGLAGEAPGVARGLVFVLAAGGLRHLNGAGEGLLGYSAEQIFWRDVLELVHEEDLPRAEALISEVIEAPRTSLNNQVALPGGVRQMASYGDLCPERARGARRRGPRGRQRARRSLTRPREPATVSIGRQERGPSPPHRYLQDVRPESMVRPASGLSTQRPAEPRSSCSPSPDLASGRRPLRSRHTL
jgi:hypothetical protein